MPIWGGCVLPDRPGKGKVMQLVVGGAKGKTKREKKGEKGNGKF